MFLIKIHYTATDKNTNFKNNEEDFIYGKGGYTATFESFTRAPKYYATNWGYSRLSDAKRALSNCNKTCEWEMSSGFWNIDCKIFEVEF